MKARFASLLASLICFLFQLPYATAAELRGKQQLIFDRTTKGAEFTLYDQATLTVAELPHRFLIIHANGDSKVFLKEGAKALFVTARDRATVVMERGAEVAYLDAFDNAELMLRGGKGDRITILDQAQAYVRYLDPDYGMPKYREKIALVHAPTARIHLYAEVLAPLQYGIIVGLWHSGEPMDLGVVLTADNVAGINQKPGLFQKLASLPPSIIVHSKSSPSFDCSKTSNRVEERICLNEQLAALDNQLAEIFSTLSIGLISSDDISKAQRKWLKTRNACLTDACIQSSYQDRIDAINRSDGMTDSKAMAICDEVVGKINNGTLAQNLTQTVKSATEEEREAWLKRFPDSFESLSGILTISHHGRQRRLGQVCGQGSCSGCTLVDLETGADPRYPQDPIYEERLRWATWGTQDYLFWSHGEPVAISGDIGFGDSRVSLISWLAPNGASYPLCMLQSGKSKPAVKTTVGKNAPVCKAVAQGAVKFTPWKEVADSYQPAEHADIHEVAHVDIDLDGKTESLIRHGYASGGGCGSYREWITITPPVAGSNMSKVPPKTNSLTALLEEHALGPITSGDREQGWELRAFSYAGKPYLLSSSDTSSARVVSLWGGEAKTWCEFNLYPKHQVEVYYPMRKWPTSHNQGKE